MSPKGLENMENVSKRTLLGLRGKSDRRKGFCLSFVVHNEHEERIITAVYSPPPFPLPTSSWMMVGKDNENSLVKNEGKIFRYFQKLIHFHTIFPPYFLI